MATDKTEPSPEISTEALKQAEALVEQEEGATHRFRGPWGVAITALAVVMTLFHLYAAISTVDQQTLREVHVGFALTMIFLLFPLVPGLRNRFSPFDLGLAAAGIYAIWYMWSGGDDFLDRAVSPDRQDLIVGGILIVLVLEATRRTTGWVMPVLCGLFWLYAMLGASLPAPWTHKGYGFERLISELYMTLNGIFGNAVEVSATLIMLFTIFGAVLQASGAGKFFIDFSLRAMGGKSNAAGRSVVLASFLLGGPSGSGVATTVTLGSVAWPLMARAGYGKTAAGGLLAAGGLGAILSPPVLGAAAFLIAEYLKISYLEVVRMAAIPTCLYYLGLLAMTEIDARIYRLQAIDIAGQDNLWGLTRRYGFHFTSLVSIIVLMIWGFSPTYAVFWAIVLAVLVSYLRRDTALMPVKLVRALEAGSVQALGTAATCACAGIVVGIITLTGLGLKFSSIAIDLAGGSLTLTAIYTALIVWVVGLAVPVTASYIICAVIAAPALIKLGVPDYAAHMFIFYYAVLSEVSPPTALSPFAAAALTRADPYVTTLQSWKYALPAFLVPFVFVLDPIGVGLLLEAPKQGGWPMVIWVTVAMAAGVVALAAGAQRHLLRPLSTVETVLCLAGGAVITFPDLVDDYLGGAHLGRLAGFLLVAAVLAPQFLRRRAVATG
jgi:TRAP transporter 4TM/12TM fusion protein